MQEAARNNNGKAAHSAWRNYDDFNEYFWLVTLMTILFGLHGILYSNLEFYVGPLLVLS